MTTTHPTGAGRTPPTEPARRLPPAPPGLASAQGAVLAVLLATLFGLAGCASTGGTDGGDTADGPPDAVPRVEPKSRLGNMESYVVFGKRYYTKASSRGYVERGIASWYGQPFHGRKTSSGEVYDMYQMTAAHKTLPLPTYARVTNLDNGRSAVVRINDRGPFVGDRVIDLSYAAARRLDLVRHGTGRVEIVSVDPRDHDGVPPGMLLASTAGMAAAGPAEPAVARRVPTTATAPSLPKPAEQSPVVAASPAPSARPQIVVEAVRPEPAERPPVVAAAPAKPTVPTTPPAVVATRAPVQPVAARSAVHQGGKAAAQPAVYLQVGAFGSRGNAEALQKRLGGRLPEPVKVQAPAKPAAGALYKVQVGPVPLSRAEALRRELSGLGLERPIMIRP